jgi:predicted aldo/keto reductase-like oxidoreductase
LGKTGEKVSILGFGSLRFPIINNNDALINEKRSSEMLEYAINNGVNYIDSGFCYHEKASEPFLGNFLSTGYREKVLIATKLPSWLIKQKEEMEDYLNLQLKNLQVEQIDVYLLHALREEYWNNLNILNVLDFMDDIKSDGRVKYVGFSFHGDLNFFLKATDFYEWDVIQTQMNFLDESYQSGLIGLKHVHKSGFGNVVMEPLRGGKLVNQVPKDVQAIWNKSPIKRSPVEWAFKYLYDMEEVDLVLSGMSTLEQVKENIEIASRSLPNSLTKEEKKIIHEVADEYHEKKDNNCTGCGYCMPCPSNVDVVKCFKEYNIAKILNDKKASLSAYLTNMKEDNRASSCINCKKCLTKCPQSINIPRELEKVKNYFEK